MYIIKNYLTDEIVAVVSRKVDAVAMTRGSGIGNEPRLIFEKK
jgi:hypothetical protein